MWTYHHAVGTPNAGILINYYHDIHLYRDNTVSAIYKREINNKQIIFNISPWTRKMILLLECYSDIMITAFIAVSVVKRVIIANALLFVIWCFTNFSAGHLTNLYKHRWKDIITNNTRISVGFPSWIYSRKACIFSIIRIYIITNNTRNIWKD